jgi:hypothetical protein
MAGLAQLSNTLIKSIFIGFSCTIGWCLRATRKLLSGLDSGGIMAIITQSDLIATVGQRGFWDAQQRVSKLQEKKPVLNRLSESIPWESFRPLLDQGYVLERKSNAGRKRIDPLILFKMIALQQLLTLAMKSLNSK